MRTCGELRWLVSFWVLMYAFAVLLASDKDRARGTIERAIEATGG